MCYSESVNAMNGRVRAAMERIREGLSRLKADPVFRSAEVHPGAARLNLQ